MILLACERAGSEGRQAIPAFGMVSEGKVGLELFGVLLNGPTPRGVAYEGDDKEHQEDEEQDLRDSCSRRSNDSESQQPGDNRYNEKH